MTKEEAIRILYSIDNADEMDKEFAEAYNMAIKALEQEPCEDCVSRKAVLDLIVANHTELNEVNVVMYSPFCKDIKQLPPVSPQPKTGRWIYGIDEDTGEKDLYAWTCSECEGKYPWQPKYCPNCGAKMESEDKE